MHAFAQSSIGGYFLAFIVIVVSGLSTLMSDRMSYLKSENSMESVVSRESAFMFNNLLFIAACFAVFWGTMLPVFSEWIQGTKITVGPPWFNQVNVPDRSGGSFSWPESGRCLPGGGRRSMR